MKKSGFKMLLMMLSITAISMLSAPAFAQGPGRGNGQGKCNGPGFGREAGPGFEKGDCLANIPGITEDQLAAIEELKIAHLRKAELIRAEVGEKQAHLNTLRLAGKQDEKAIDKTIDEIAKLHGDLMKEREAHQRSIKALLTDKQKTYFDARPGQGRSRGEGFGRDGKPAKGMGHHRGNCGACPYAK